MVSKKKVFTEIESEFSAKIGNSNVFSAQKQVVSKKKKKKVFTEIETHFSAKIGNSNAFSHRITTSTSQLQHSISFGGGYFQFFTKNRPKKQQKRAILHTSQANGGGGLEPWLRYATASITLALHLAQPHCASITKHGHHI